MARLISFVTSLRTGIGFKGAKRGATCQHFRGSRRRKGKVVNMQAPLVTQPNSYCDRVQPKLEARNAGSVFR